MWKFAIIELSDFFFFFFFLHLMMSLKDREGDS